MRRKSTREKPHGPSRLCEQQGCGHFRSVHRSGGGCEACDCGAFVFVTAPEKPKRPLRRFTDEECEQILARLNEGVPYAEVAKTFGRRYNTLRQKFPGYGGNVDQEAKREGREKVMSAWDHSDQLYAARAALNEAERRHGYNCPCGRRNYAFGLCHTCYARMRRAKEFGQS